MLNTKIYLTISRQASLESTEGYMISDFSAVIASYSRPFTKITSNSFEHNGITYDGVPSQFTVRGVMMPVSSADQEVILKLGYALLGKVSFYVGGDEPLLTNKDIVIDSSGIEWVVLPTNSANDITDWREHGNYVKYILSRKILQED